MDSSVGKMFTRMKSFCCYFVLIVLSLQEIVYMFCFYCVTYVYCAVVISSRYTPTKRHGFVSVQWI